MDDREMEKQLRDALKRLGIAVRVETLEEGVGGLCRLEQDRLVVLSHDLPRSKRIEILLNALRRLDTAGIYLPPAIRDRLEEDPDVPHTT